MKNRWFIGVLLSLCLILVSFSSFSSHHYRLALEKNREENGRLLETIAALKEHFEKTQSRIETVEEALNRYSGLSETMRSLLTQKGHLDPEGFLLTVLKEKEDLIHSTPVLGGTFFFTKIIILKDDLAFAEFEDGHISGYLLIAFHYDVSRDQVDVSNAYEFIE